jgi:large subunit ribosomal protein L17
MCAAGTCAAGLCDKKCDCGAKKAVAAVVPLAAVAHTVHAAHVAPAAPVHADKHDDLVIIEGIGPAINKVLNSHGVHTFAQLVTTPKETIHEWLNAVGPQFKFHDASTWAEQAALARDGKMTELEALKVKLDNGQHV